MPVSMSLLLGGSFGWTRVHPLQGGQGCGRYGDPLQGVGRLCDADALCYRLLPVGVTSQASCMYRGLRTDDPRADTTLANGLTLGTSTASHYQAVAEWNNLLTRTCDNIEWWV